MNCLFASVARTAFLPLVLVAEPYYVLVSTWCSKQVACARGHLFFKPEPGNVLSYQFSFFQPYFIVHFKMNASV